MADERGSSAAVLLAFLSGAALGAVAALLMAPQSGREASVMSFPTSIGERTSSATRHRPRGAPCGACPARGALLPLLVAKGLGGIAPAPA